jgi:hypothetical protein
MLLPIPPGAQIARADAERLVREFQAKVLHIGQELAAALGSAIVPGVDAASIEAAADVHSMVAVQAIDDAETTFRQGVLMASVRQEADIAQ